MILLIIGEHSGYWSQYKGQYEHWRFSDGFTQGWDDAYWFFTQEEYTSTSIPELGFPGQWCKRRLSGHVKEKGSSNNLWEYGEQGCMSSICIHLLIYSSFLEHGFKQGVKAASSSFLSTYWYRTNERWNIMMKDKHALLVILNRFGKLTLRIRLRNRGRDA